MFRLATTSFIIPDTRLNNSIYLENIVDEVELLYFDSLNENDLPDKFEIDKLAELPLDYNIHMPIDIDLSVEKNWKKMFVFAEILSKLKPNAYFIHPVNDITFIDNLLKFNNKFGNVSLENIDYDLQIFDELKDSNISYCMDIGHLILNNLDVYNFIEKWNNKISHIHLHGVYSNKDHNSIKYLDFKLLSDIIEFAHKNDKTICLEVFNKQIFEESFEILRGICEEKNYSDYRWRR